MLPSDALVKLPINDRQTFSSRYALDYCYDGVRDSRHAPELQNSKFHCVYVWIEILVGTSTSITNEENIEGVFVSCIYN